MKEYFTLAYLCKHCKETLKNKPINHGLTLKTLETKDTEDLNIKIVVCSHEMIDGIRPSILDFVECTECGQIGFAKEDRRERSGSFIRPISDIEHLIPPVIYFDPVEKETLCSNCVVKPKYCDDCA